MMALGCTRPPAQLVTTAFRGDSVRYHTIRSAGKDSADRDLGETADAAELTTYNGAPGILLVERTLAQGKPYIDSALVLRRGLTPVWETYHLGARQSRINYDGARVRRTDVEGDSVVRRVDHTYDVHVFHFAELDMIIRAVPLRPGYQTILPLYSEYDDALEMDTVRVEGRGPDGVWDVRFADKVIIAHYGIDGTTRQIARHEIERHAGGPHFRTVFEGAARG
jgi:hypothetical protein